jgi:subtilase family serine protease
MVDNSRSAHRAFSMAGLLILSILIGCAASAFAQSAQILGPEDPTKQITVTYWLQQHNKAALDKLVEKMYDPTSPEYHHWLSISDYQARFAPSAADMAVVRQHLAANNLSVVRTDKFNHAVTVTGTVRDLERATGVQMNRAIINGEERRVRSGELAISGPAGKIVYAVQGLAEIKYKNQVIHPIDPDTGKPFPSISLEKGPREVKQYYNANCLRKSQLLDLKTPGDSGGPYEIYSGARYGEPNIASGTPNLPPCGYDAPQIQEAYGLTALYRQKLNGSGQNIAIVDAYGSDTITADANTFSQINNLPAISSNNLAIFYPTGSTSCGNATGAGCGWDAEVSLDVEWAHAFAPQAGIALIIAANDYDYNLDLALMFAIETQIAPVVSNSWGGAESALVAGDPGELTVENNICETAAALGISVHAASGDDGDLKAQEKVPTVLMPGAAPYATSIGGTSMFLTPQHTIQTQTGWGNNITRIATYSSGCGSSTCDPVLLTPDFEGFYAGAGGGTSAYWHKPSFQGKLSGTFRQVPDIAYLADPYTGVEIIDTESGSQFIEPIGGTSAATPMFSAMWVIATQAAGKWLGQAAPLLYTLPSSAITDIVPVNGPDNVNGFTDSPPAAPTNYSAAALVAPLENAVDSVDFMSLLYQGVTTRWYALSFGTDTSLFTATGWDNVTGLGVPNGASFVSAVAAAAKK